MTRVLDPVKNFAEVIPTGTYTAASTTINLTTGTGGTLPDVTTEGAFNLVWFNSTDYTGPALDPQKEIVRVVARTSDILTVLRGQEGTTASTKAIAGKVYKMTLAVTEHIIDQVNTQLELDKTMSDVLTASGLIGNSGKFLTTDGLTISWSNVSGAGVSTFTNLGAGSGLVAAIVGVDLQVKSIIAGTNVTITSTATAVTINATGGGGGAAVSFQILATDPVTPTNGDVWYNSTTNLFKFRENGTTVTIGSGNATTQEDVTPFAGTTITLATTVIGSVFLFKNGVLQTIAGGDYSIAGQVVTVSPASLITDRFTALVGSIPSGTTTPGGNNTFTGTNTFDGAITNNSTVTNSVTSATTYADASTISNQATETYGAGYAMTATAGASFNFAGATVTGLSVSALDTYSAYNTSGTVQVLSVTQQSDTILYFMENSTVNIKKLDTATGIVSILGTTGTSITGSRIISDSLGNAYVSTFNIGIGNLNKCTPAGVVTIPYSTAGAFQVMLCGVDLNDNVYWYEPGAGLFKKMTQAGVVSTITLTGASTDQGVRVIGKSSTETYVLTSTSTPTALLFTLNNSGVATNLPISPITTGSNPTSAFLMTSGNLGFNIQANYMEVTYAGVTVYNKRMVDLSTQLETISAGVVYGVSSAGSYLEFTPATDTYSFGGSIYFGITANHKLPGITKKVFIPSSSNARIVLK